MDDVARDALERAARLSRLEEAARLMGEAPPARGRDVRPLLGIALALLLTLYPGISAAAGAIIII